MDYLAGKAAASDHIGAYDMLNKDGKSTRHHISSDFKTGAGNMRIESKSGATCFVASVAYDDPNHIDVMFLRWFRDNRLRSSQGGKVFINWYWRNGPKLAKVVEKSTLMKKISRFIISFIVKMLRLTV